VILLARHGETAENRDGRFQGQEPVPLNDLGREQAHALAAELRTRGGIASFYASPIARARETAEVVAAAIGQEPVYDDRLAEADTGDWTGRLKQDVQREDPEGWARYLRGGDWRFPGGESLPEQSARVEAALADIAAATEGDALVVCHRGVIRVALAVRQPAGLGGFHEIVVPNGALVTL
jgi:probable phosphoglycerate mutase